jgi:hypothetical protein
MIKIIFILVLLVLLFLILNYACITESFTNEEYVLPKNIYCFWHDADDKLMNTFIDNWKKKTSSGWQIHFINNTNINNYVSKEFLEKYDELETFRFSDFLRLELLKNNGGVWIDISTALVNGRFLDQYYEEMIENKYDICIYEFKLRTVVESEPYLENWFFMAPKNSKFITDLYNEFERGRKMNFVVYKKDVLKPSGINLKNTIRDDDYYTYLMQHAIIHYLLKTGNKYNINKKSADESFFKLHNSVSWNNEEIINIFLNNNDWTNYYAIKFGSKQRQLIKNEEEFIKRIDSL